MYPLVLNHFHLLQIQFVILVFAQDAFSHLPEDEHEHVAFTERQPYGNKVCNCSSPLNENMCLVAVQYNPIQYIGIY